MTQRGGEEVFAFVIVAYAPEERDEFRIVLLTAHHHFSLLFRPFALKEVVGTETIVGEVLVICVEA